MTNNKIVSNYLKDKGYNFKNNSEGLLIENNNELLIKGSSLDLIELCDYILSVALSEGKDHIHIDESSLINNNSKIKELIIEKE